MHEDVLDDFLAESAEHLDLVERELLAMERFTGDWAALSELLNQLFRAVHSIKGAAGFLELGKVVELTHAMENIFGSLRKSNAKPALACADAMLKGVDKLRQLLSNLAAMPDIPIQEEMSALRTLLDEPQKEENAPARTPLAGGVHLYRLDFAAEDQELVRLEASSIGTVMAERGENIWLSSVLEPGLLAMALDAVHARATQLCADDCHEEIAAHTQAHVHARAHAKMNANEAHSGSAAAVRGGEHAPLHAERRVTEPLLAKSSAGALPSFLQATAPGKDTSSDVAAGSAPGSVAGRTEKAASEGSVRIDLGLLEQLMSLAGELVLVRNRHVRWAAGNREDEDALREISLRLDTVTTELQTSIMKTRMQPLERVFAKLPRLVREVARQLGKDIELQVTGGEVEVDRAILESLADPLTHLLRNSCDHGIESAETRRASGKSAQGTVRVSATHESGQILIEIRDDGKGIDPDFIAAKAVEKGIVSRDEVQTLDARRKLELIMLPGFSTAAAVSNISGRGVGMDVVRSGIEKLGGTVEIDSAPGRGSRFILRLPLTLAIIQSLIVMDRGRPYLIPRSHLEEVVSLVGDEVSERVQIVGGQEVLRYHKSLLQLVRLESVFDHRQPLRAEQRETLAAEHQRRTGALRAAGGIPVMDVAVVRVGERRYGLVVDQTREMEEIVVKPVHPAQKTLGIYLGATVIGDGRVAMILDVEGVARHGLGEIHFTERHDPASAYRVRSDDAQKMLLFEGGGGERFAIGLSFIRRIHALQPDDLEPVGDRLFARIGGRPVRVARLDDALRVSACKLEGELLLIMPRYGEPGCGILAKRICGIAQIVPELGDTGWREDGVMGTAVVDGHTTIFPDIYYVCEAALHPGGAAGLLRARAQRPEGNPKRVLLAEDAPFFRRLIASYLRREHIAFESAANGEEALRKLETGRYDLLLSDIEMPGMDGRELARKIRGEPKWRDMPLVALTALDTEEDRRRCLEAGFDGYMVKLNRDQLLSLLDRYLGSGRVAEASRPVPEGEYVEG